MHFNLTWKKRQNTNITAYILNMCVCVSVCVCILINNIISRVWVGLLYHFIRIFFFASPRLSLLFIKLIFIIYDDYYYYLLNYICFRFKATK